MNDETNVLQIADELLNYMRRFPNAADTEEHITHWWLNANNVEQEKWVVSSALQMLVTNGLIERVALPDNRVVYRLKVTI